MRMIILGVIAASSLSTAALAAEGAVLKLKTATTTEQFIQEGSAWRCKADICISGEVKALPPVRVCRKLVATLGPATALKYRGKDLDAA